MNRSSMLIALLCSVLVPAVARGQTPPATLESEAFARAAALIEAARFTEPFFPATLTTPSPSDDAAAPWTATELAARADEFNPSLAAARAGHLSSSADLALARSSRLPRLDASVSATLIGNPVGPVSIGAGSLGDYAGTPFPAEDIQIYDGQEASWYVFKLTGEQPLITWGKIPAAIDMARASVNAATLQYEKTRREARLELGGTLDALSVVAELSKVLDAQAAIVDRLVFISELSAEAGFITSAELLEARIAAKESDAARAELANRREGLLQRIRSLCDLPDLNLEDIVLPEPGAGVPRFDTAGLMAMARIGSVDLGLVAALEDARSAARDLAAAKKPWLPDLGLRVELSYQGARFPFLETDWFRQDDWNLNISFGTSSRIFDGGESRARLAKADAELAEAAARAEEARLGVDGFIRTGNLELELARSRLEYDALKLSGHRETVRNLGAELMAGAGLETSWLRSLLDMLSTVGEGWQRLAEYRSALWKLEALLPNP
ncbi:MAG: TolC family protein [Spirochaetales bacterium]|nr:TolC family protein [Spirochaetales bacterium]